MDCTKKYRLYLLPNGNDCDPLYYGTYKFNTYEQYVSRALCFVHNWINYRPFDIKDIDFTMMKSGFSGYHAEKINRLFKFEKTNYLNDGFSDYFYPLFNKFGKDSSDGFFAWLEEETDESVKVSIKESNIIMWEDGLIKEENIIFPIDKIINEKEKWIDKKMEFYYDLNEYGELVINSSRLNDRLFKFIFVHEHENCLNDYIYIIKLLDEEQKWVIEKKIKSKYLYDDYIKIYIQRYGYLPLKKEFGKTVKCPDYIYEELKIDKNNVGKIIEINNEKLKISNNYRYEFVMTRPNKPTPNIFALGVYIWNDDKIINMNDIVKQLIN